MLKKIAQPLSLVIALGITSSITPINVIGSSIAFGSELEVSKVLTQNKNDIIKASIVNFNTQKDLGVSVNEAIDGFTNNIINNEVTVADLSNFIDSLKSISDNDKEDFREIKRLAQIGAESEMDSEEFGVFTGRLLETVDPQGLSWSGCAGLASGVVLLVASVVVGIVALTKTAGESRIKKKYQDKRSQRTAKYNSDIAAVHGRLEAIDQEINNLNGDIEQYENQIDEAQSDINYNLGIIAGSNDPEVIKAAGDRIKTLNDNIDSYQAYIDNAQSSIAGLNLEKDDFQNPQFVANRLNALEIDYTADLSAINSEEQSKIDLIPANKRLAKTLGIGAGIGAAIGTYLTIDGTRDCR
jgi:DNA repair exonuclease SbcCD ATPase subunit